MTDETMDQSISRLQCEMAFWLDEGDMDQALRVSRELDLLIVEVMRERQANAYVGNDEAV